MRTLGLLLCLTSAALVAAGDTLWTIEDQEAKAAWAWAMKVEVKKNVEVKKKVVVTRTVEAGPLHSHRCPVCGTTWSHGAASHGNLAAHTCPNCNRLLPYPWYPLR